jgi:hypothetical protein
VAPPDELDAAVSELDDDYLKVLLLLSLNRARSEEPRRAGFWHALAVTLAEEQEQRRQGAELTPGATAPVADERPALEAVLEELHKQVASLESEIRESAGEMDVAGGTDSA